MTTATDTETKPANPDEYDGWTNRETWAVNLWLSNDQGLDELTRERIKDNVESETASWPYDDLDKPVTVWAADAVKLLVEEILNPDEGEELMLEESRRSMASDIGSLWRVDWFEVAAAFEPEDAVIAGAHGWEPTE